MMAARTLIHLFRSLNPEMLQKKFRVSVSCVLYLLKTDVPRNDENWSQYPLENVESNLCFPLPAAFGCGVLLFPHFLSSDSSNS